MKLTKTIVATASLAAVLLSGSVLAQDQAIDKEKVSYMVGMQLGKSVKGLSDHVDLNVVIQAMTDVYQGKELKMTEEEAKEIRMAFSKQMQAEQTKKVEAEKQANLQEGQKYLAENGKRNEVTTTASGLQYEVVTNGSGEKPVDGDRVKVHYRGTLIDGTEFDSSYSRGEPVEFPLNGVIKGWTEALKLMPAGSKYKLFIPSELAYGERGTRGPIGPNSTLLFEVELLDIIKPEATKPE